MHLYSLDDTEMMANANAVKDAVIIALEREGLLTKPASEIAATYAVVLHKPGWLGKLFEGIFTAKEKMPIRVDVFKIIK